MRGLLRLAQGVWCTRRGRAELDKLAGVFEDILTGLARARDDRAQDEVATPPVYPYDGARPDPGWAYMGACRHCGSEKPMLIFWRMKTTSEIRENARGGLEVSAAWWPWARCENCHHESEGQVTREYDDP